jgi:hypothetical protein
MKKKRLEDADHDFAGEAFLGTSRPERNSSSARKSTARASSKRAKRNKSASRKGNTTGGIHQRGDKRTLR